MFTFLLISSISRCLDGYKLIEKLGVTKCEAGERYIAYGPTGMQDGWIAIEKIEGAERDFDASELDLVRKSIADPSFFLVEGRDGKVNFSDRFILGLDQAEDFLIDNDHGLIENAEVVKLRIKNGIGWINTGQ